MSYWGNDAICISRGWNVFEGIIGQEEVALQISGIPVELWFPIGGQEWGRNDCSCVKEKAPDIFCASCYGTGALGGYHKYGYNYLDIGSTMSSILSYNPAKIQLNENIRPFRLQLVDGVDTAQITTAPLNFYFNPAIEYKVDAYLKDTNNTWVVKYSTNNGTSWSDISNIVNEAGYRTVIFKVTLTRATGERSPVFEFLRIRSPKSEVKNHYILMSRTRNLRDVSKDRPGLKDFEPGVSYWTILDLEIPFRSFIQILPAINPVTGVCATTQDNPFVNERFELFDFNRSFFDQYRFRQVFSARIISREREVYWKVF